MLELLGTYRNLILQTLFSLFLTLILSFLRIPIIFLHGLCTYIQPENLGQNNTGNGLRPAIRRPSSTDDPKSNIEVRRRNRSKDKSEFDETNAQIFRIKLDEDHLRSRMYFNEYNSLFVLSFLAVSCFLLQNYFGVEDSHGVLGNGLIFPLVLGFIGLCKVFVALGKVSIERSASKKSEKKLSLIFGGLGFVFGIIISAGVFPKGFDFQFGSVDAFCCILISFSMACIGGFMYMPAGRSARSFWVGTDQIRSNLSIISCGWFGRMILYANYIVSVFTSLLWIHPLAEILVKRSHNGGASSSSHTGLVGNVGTSSDDFGKFRDLCLLLAGLLQAMAVRPNLQIFLNEAVLSWYQRLHGSKTPDLEFSRAKMFLHNHFLCLVALQFLAPSVLVILFLGLSQIDLSSFAVSRLVCGSLPCSDFIRQVGLLMSWWVVFVWSSFASASLVFYRRGVLYVS